MATSNHTSNYSLSQYAAGDQVKFLTNYNQDMAAIDAALKAIHDSDTAKVPTTRTVAGLPLSADIALAQLIAAGLASGTNGKANAATLADNASQLGGVDAANFPQISSGAWTPYLYGDTVAGSPTYVRQSAQYVHIGEAVLILISGLQISAKGGMAGRIKIGGLPFIPSTRGSLCVGNASGCPSGIVGQFVEAIPSIYLGKDANTDLMDTDITDTCMLWGSSGLYFA